MNRSHTYNNKTLKISGTSLCMYINRSKNEQIKFMKRTSGFKKHLTFNIFLKQLYFFVMAKIDGICIYFCVKSFYIYI